jgi:tRNA threonylcarbamoyladenosine biosynthesis protein TsaB
MTGIDISEIDAFAISGGPGSFTGLRIGSATVKGLAMATGKPVINVPTLEGLACNFFGTDSVICPLMDARRNQTYTALYAYEGDKLVCLSPQKAVKIEEILEEVNQLGRKVIFLGDGVPVFKEKIAALVTVPWQLAPAHLAAQRAGAVGVRAITYYKEGKTETAAQHKPEYLRLSQAERERMEKAGS